MRLDCMSSRLEDFVVDIGEVQDQVAFAASVFSLPCIKTLKLSGVRPDTRTKLEMLDTT